jgi:peptidylprolyl isomerase
VSPKDFNAIDVAWGFTLTLENGTLILADYTGKVKDTGQIIDTTRKSDAEKAGTADPTRSYEPRLIAVGEGWVLKGLDEALAKSEPGQTVDVELPPDKAFGNRDPTKVSRYPIRKFGEKASELEVGKDVEIDNRTGIVRSIESGRVFVDFNHRYAGKTLEYNIEIKQKLNDDSSKIEALIRRRLPIEKEKVKFETVDSKEIKISIPNDYFLLDGLQIIKRAISNDLFKFLKPVEKVEFVEDYQNPAVKKESQETPPPESSPEAAQGVQPSEPAPAAEQTQPEAIASQVSDRAP